MSTVTLNITHTRDEDLDVFLVGPDGTKVELFTDVGGPGDNFTGTTLDDRERDYKIAKGVAPFSGTFQPEGYLDSFRGKNTQGTWKLEITDDTRGETGRLNSWSLTMAQASAVSTNFLDKNPLILGDVDASSTEVAMAVWIESKGQNSLWPLMTMAARYNAAAGAWGTPAILSNSSSTGFSPCYDRIVGDGQGNYLAVWTQVDTSQQASVWMNRYVAESGWQGPQTIDTTGVSYFYLPAVAMAYDPVANVSKAVLVLSISPASGAPADVKVNLLTNFAANTWSGWSLAESRAVEISPSRIQVGMAANGDFLLMFPESVAPYDLYYRHYDWSTGWTGPESTIESMPEDINLGSGGKQKLAMNKAGAAIVAWHQKTGTGGTSWQLWARRWNGSDWAAAPELVRDELGVSVLDAVAIGDNGEAAVSYSQMREGAPFSDVFVRRHDGIAWQSTVKVDSEDLSYAAGSRLAMDGSGNIMAVWGQSDGEFRNNWSAKFDRSAAAWSPAAKIENAPFDATSPAVAMNSSGIATSVWRQPDATVYHVYASRTSLAPAALISQAVAMTGNGAALASRYDEPLKKVRIDTVRRSESRAVEFHTRDLSYTVGVSANRLADDSRLARDNHRQAEVEDLFARWESDPLELLSVPELGM